MNIQIELILLTLSILFLISIVAGKMSSRFGVPALLLFLCVGMLGGEEGVGIQFNNFELAQTIGTISLCIILFSGGMDTKISEIRPVLRPGIALATMGVLLTAIVTGALSWCIINAIPFAKPIGFLSALLLAAIMSSTDSASVFAILRTKNLQLKNNLRPLLELESGSNDPMAYILVITLIEVLTAPLPPSPWSVLLKILLQISIGALAGFALGKFAVWFINRLKMNNASLYPILVLAFCIFTFSLTYFLQGNGYLAVYIGGLVIGNHSFQHKRSTLNFFDGLTWLCQLLMFLTLGLLVTPSQLLDVLVPGLIVSFVMIFLARPISVFLSLMPFGTISIKSKAYVSWCGLRGAVPIIFATMPLAARIPESQYLFNIAFLCTIVSLLVQGTTLTRAAKAMKLNDEREQLKKLEDFDVDFSDEIKSITTEIEITDEILRKGAHLMDLGLPDKTLVVMVKRRNKYFVPTGKTTLKANDKLLIITDDHNALMETYKSLHITQH